MGTWAYVSAPSYHRGYTDQMVGRSHLALGSILFWVLIWKIIYSPVFIFYKYIFVRMHVHAYTQRFFCSLVFVVVAFHTETTRSLCCPHNCSVWTRETWPSKSLYQKFSRMGQSCDLMWGGDCLLPLAVSWSLVFSFALLHSVEGAFKDFSEHIVFSSVPVFVFDTPFSI